MTNIRARNLFTAILVARAICGIGVVQAGWLPEDKTIPPGHIVTGTGVCAGLVYYLFKMVCGAEPTGMDKKDTQWGIVLAVIVSMLLLTVTGLQVPVWLDRLLRSASEIVMGGNH